MQLFPGSGHYLMMQNAEALFWRLIEENRVALGRFALALTGSSDDAKDLVSETVLAAHRSFSALRDIDGFRKSLYTIARRLHKKKVWRKRIFAPIQLAVSVEDRGIGESSYDVEVLLLALEKLPAKQREAVLLFEITGLSLEEIRDIQGGTLSGVKSRVTRGREELAQLMKDEERTPLPAFKKKPIEAAAVSATI